MRAQVNGLQALQPAVRKVRGCADSQPVLFTKLAVMCFIHGTMERMETVVSMCHKRLAGGSRHHAAVASLEQLDPESLLQLPQLLAQGRFADPDPRGGPRHVALFIQHEKQLKIADTRLTWSHRPPRPTPSLWVKGSQGASVGLMLRFSSKLGLRAGHRTAKSFRFQ